AVRRSDALGPRRARLASTGAGILVSAACLAYLALWWSAVNPGPAWSAPVWTGVALAAALSISLLIGHAVAVTAGAVVARETPNAPAPVAGARERRLAFLFRVAAFAAAAALLVATVRPAGTTEPPAAPEFAVVPTGQRVVVAGIDGFDVRFLDAARGRLRTPTFRALEPASAAIVTDPADRDPARVWTTIATGVPPDRHGVSELELRRVAGVEGAVARSRLGVALGVATDSLRLTRPAIVSGIDRKEKTFWEVAAEKGLSTAVVNWWATWPATGPGIVLSDRAILRLEHAGELNNEIFPPELYDDLRPGWRTLSADASAIAMTSFEEVEPAAVRAALLRSAELDATAVLLAAHPAIGAIDLKVVYLPGLDIAQHALASADPAPGAAAMAARASALARYYVFLEGLLSRLMDRESLFVLVTHPGRVSSASPGRIGLTGAVAAGAGGTGALVDVAPTVLYALGLPASRAISGKPLTGLFAEVFVRRVPVRTVDTYGRRVATRPSRGGQPLDNEMLERLRSLGYVR
ncbi:MAG: alkaline phosphatase family protein, partial [Vicinamibacterales bacterium]